MNVLDSSLAETQPQAAALPYFPYNISFVDCDSSEALRGLVEDQLTRLSHFYDRITDAKVFVRIPHKHSGARLFHIHVQLDVPGKRLVASREPAVDERHLDVRIAVRDAFQKLTRQLEDFVKSRNE
ncbi:MAG: ribosome-associated translation inhibitor RaiA [Calothrix sp. SM1_5_4]|nr:ribosome-associated translation inhibitor RaiA [Calothrix sp. SM1_5_4]